MHILGCERKLTPPSRERNNLSGSDGLHAKSNLDVETEPGTTAKEAKRAGNGSIVTFCTSAAEEVPLTDATSIEKPYVGP